MPIFAHHRLEAYHASLDLTRAAHRLARGIPRGHRSLAQQLSRAAAAVPLLVAEGAHRVSAGTKRQRFAEARGECDEVAAAAEVLEVLALARTEDVRPVLDSAHRATVLLAGLIRKFS